LSIILTSKKKRVKSLLPTASEPKNLGLQLSPLRPRSLKKGQTTARLLEIDSTEEYDTASKGLGLTGTIAIIDFSD